ncbi:MAG: hypothetical protein JRD87_07715 [Deltaproteobacteria bacterium]|nr:hypothetical protein [Deltaproteobacteria bacterium]
MAEIRFGCWVYPFEAGSAPRVDEYVDVRAGLSWPTTASPGYFCIFGLQKVPGDKMPLVLFSEGGSANLDSFFAMYAEHTKKTFCPRAFAPTEDKRGAGFLKSLRQFRIDKDINFPLPADSSKFDDPVYGIKLIERRVKEKSLAIAEPPIPSYCRGILIDQVRSIKDQDATDHFEERFYAVAALIRVLGSLEVWPYRKARYKDFNFTNFDHRRRSKKDSGYQEVFAG